MILENHMVIGEYYDCRADVCEEEMPCGNDVCPYCSTEFEVGSTGFGPVWVNSHHTDAQGTNWCDERCEVLYRLDQRWFYLQRVKDAIAFELPEVAGMYAKQLVTFALAFDVISEVTKEVF